MFYLSHQCQKCHNFQYFKQHMESFLENGSIYQLFHLIGIDTVPYRSEPVKIMQIRLNPGPRHWQLGLLNFFQLVKFGPGFGFGLSTWTPRSKDRVLKVTDPEMQFLKDCFSRGFWAWAFSDSSFSLIFYPRFSVLQYAIHEKTRVFLYRWFFVWNFKTRVEYGFLTITLVTHYNIFFDMVLQVCKKCSLGRLASWPVERSRVRCCPSFSRTSLFRERTRL
jgi:hypothetical protein